MIVIAGGRGFIGSAICDEMQKEYNVYVLDLPKYDVTDESLVKRLATNYGVFGKGVDVLINCVAIKTPNFCKPTTEFPLEEWETVMRGNVTSCFLLAKHFAPYMNKGGSMVFFSSIYGVKAPDFSLYKDLEFNTPLVYSTSKTAVIGLTRHLAVELAPIRVNCISPGGVFDEQPAVFYRRYSEKTPLKRMAQVEDIISGIRFLVENTHVTGHNLVIDGGFTL